jgi:hypothetical protein
MVYSTFHTTEPGEVGQAHPNEQRLMGPGGHIGRGYSLLGPHGKISEQYYPYFTISPQRAQLLRKNFMELS